MQKTEHIVHEKKAICQEFSIVGQEKGLHSEEKDEGDETKSMQGEAGLHTDEMEEEISGGTSEFEVDNSKKTFICMRRARDG